MNDSELEKIKDALDKNTGGGREYAAGVELAKKYVADYPDYFADLEGKSIEDCVKTVEAFRAAGLEEWEWRGEAYIIATFEPQKIGGDVTLGSPQNAELN